MPAIAFQHDRDPRIVLQEECAPFVEGITPLGAEVLLAVYTPPERTKGGIILSDKTKDESKYQGVAGLILKMGPLAFQDDDRNSFPVKPKEGDWVLFRVGDTYGVDMQRKTVRFIQDNLIKAIIAAPDMVA